MARSKSAKKSAAKPRKARRGPKADGDGRADMEKLRKIFDEAAQNEAPSAIQLVDVECPHCGEEFEIRVDITSGGSEMVEECRSCCKAISFFVEVDDDGQVSASALQI